MKAGATVCASAPYAHIAALAASNCSLLILARLRSLLKWQDCIPAASGCARTTHASLALQERRLRPRLAEIRTQSEPQLHSTSALASSCSLHWLDRPGRGWCPCLRCTAPAAWRAPRASDARQNSRRDCCLTATGGEELERAQAETRDWACNLMHDAGVGQFLQLH